jgi:hypothetical protein
VSVGPFRDLVLDRLDGFLGGPDVDDELVGAAFPLAADGLAQKVEAVVDVDHAGLLRR